ncbi:MAG: FAD-binding oxidoreductase [Bacteroidia bacterium]|nr:FAD-binding oxidoreductase [Bacteroidia bacterium]NND52367.1 FAD-dependent oxidoreductase [Flavobacteriaceae bacterium]
MNVDYIIVGSGLAGIAFCETLLKHGKSFVVFDDGSQQSSSVAGGLYNPVILNRFTMAWKANEQLELALPMYASIEQKLNLKLIHKQAIYRLFTSIEEQNNWFQACDDPKLSEFLSSRLVQTKFGHVQSSFGFGEVLHCGRIDTGLLSVAYKAYLKQSGQLIEASFEYDQLKIDAHSVSYKSLKARQIVFAEGFGLQHNPFFKDLPLNGTKGELVTIHAPDLKIDFVLKSSVFIIPLGDDLYRIGSTYNWTDKSNEPTEKGREELLWKLDKIIDCKYTVQKHLAGIRPTVKDRRPLVGRHHNYNHIYVLNGLGTRGVMIAPYVADQLFRYIEEGQALTKEISISRFA